MITLIVNTPTRSIVDGADSRNLALSQFVASAKGSELCVCDDFFYATRLNRGLQVLRLVWKVLRSPNRYILMPYPTYPFHWQLKVTPYFLVSLVFSVLLRAAASVGRKTIIIDVADLDSFSYQDIGLRMEMAPRTLRAFERFIFSLADQVWVASRTSTNVVITKYGIAAHKTKTVLNGAFRSSFTGATSSGVGREDSTFRLVYAGRMDGTRQPDIAHLIETFLHIDAGPAELHLCGAGGEWIATTLQNPRIICHGVLNVEQMAALFRQCTMGLIPVPVHGYWSMAFPTKFGLYIAHGLPILTVNAAEPAYWVQKLDVGLSYAPDELEQALERCVHDHDSVRRWQQNAVRCSESFFWDTIFARAFLSNNQNCGAPDGLPSGVQGDTDRSTL